MNRSEARDLFNVPDSVLTLLGIPLENRKFVDAFGRGDEILYNNNKNGSIFTFCSPTNMYKIVEPTQTINGSVCPMYMTDKVEIADIHYIISVTAVGNKTNSFTEGFKRGLCFKSGSDAQEVLEAYFPEVQE